MDLSRDCPINFAVLRYRKTAWLAYGKPLAESQFDSNPAELGRVEGREALIVCFKRRSRDLEPIRVWIGLGGPYFSVTEFTAHSHNQLKRINIFIHFNSVVRKSDPNSG